MSLGILNSKRPVTIRRSLIVNLALVVLVLSAAILATMVFGARTAVQSLSGLVMTQSINEIEAKLDCFFDPVITQLMLVESWGEDGRLNLTNAEALKCMLMPIVEANGQISGLMVADEQGGEFMLAQTSDEWINRHIVMDGVDREIRAWTWNKAEPQPQAISGDRYLDYHPPDRPWHMGALTQYKTAAASDTPTGPAAIHWTEPYRFFTTGELGITASLAYTDSTGSRYVIGFDVLLSDISKFVSEMPVLGSGHVTIFGDEGRIVGMSNDVLASIGLTHDAVLLARAAEINWPLADDAHQALTTRETAKQALLTPLRFVSDGQPWWCVGRPYALGPERQLWPVALVPEADLLGSLQQRRSWIAVITVLVLGLGIARIVMLAKSYSRPLEELAQQSERISRGDLDNGQTVQSNVREVRQLGEAHERMRRGLQTLMKMERDLQLAQQIQQRTFPRHLPELRGFDLAAWSEPAEETGGDTYDVVGYERDNGGVMVKPGGGAADHAILLLADATGHGIGPALSVTQLRAMLRMAVHISPDLSVIAEHMNEQLHCDLPSGRFITAWLGCLCAETGTLSYLSAGQGPLLHYVAESDDVRVMDADQLPFGIVDTMDTTISEPLPMNRGDVFAVISDGIFEAKRPGGEQFGTERVKAILREHRNASAETILTTIREAVTEFTTAAPADDDRTIIIVKRG